MAKQRILVLKSQGIKQFVGAEPAFSAIRAAHPDSAIDLMTSHELGRLAKGAPLFDRVLARHVFEDNTTRQRFARQLKKMKYNLVYDLDGSRETLALRKKIGGFTGARWVGPRHLKRVSREQRQQQRVALSEFPTLDPAAIRSLLSGHGVEVAPRRPDISWVLAMRNNSASMQPAWYGVSGLYALILPQEGPEVGWSAEYHAAFAIKLIEGGVTPVLIGPKSLIDLGQEISLRIIQSGSNGGLRALVDLINKTDLAQIAALASSAEFFVSGITDELSLILGVGCGGIVMSSRQNHEDIETIRGRSIVQVHGQDIETYHPDDATRLLASMGLFSQ